MTSLLSRNARIGKSGIFQALYPPQLHIQFCGDAVLPLPAHSDVGPGQCVPGFSTALPKYDMQESENSPAFPAALALYSHPPLLVWPRAGVHGPILGDRDSPFLDHGCSRTRPAGGGGAAGTPHSRSTALGVSGREAISQPVFMCSDTTRARLFHLSSFPLSQWRVQCLLASPRCHRQTLPGKNNPVLLQTSTSRSLAQPPWVTEPLPVLEPAGPGSTGMGPVCSTGSEPRLAPSATPPRAGGAGTGTAWPWPSHCFPCWMLNWPRARARWWKPAGT